VRPRFSLSGKKKAESYGPKDDRLAKMSVTRLPLKCVRDKGIGP